MVKAIKVKSSEDIKKINQIVTQYDFDVWIHSKDGMVDAKSLLGMFLLGLNEPLNLVIDDNIDASQLFDELSEYLEINDGTK